MVTTWTPSFEWFSCGWEKSQAWPTGDPDEAQLIATKFGGWSVWRNRKRIAVGAVMGISGADNSPEAKRAAERKWRELVGDD